MRKLTLRSEHLGELSTAELRQVAGAAAEANNTVSDGSCVCTIGLAVMIVPCDVSDGSCACAC